METKRMVKGLILWAVLFWVMSPWIGYSAVPATINYQGYLTDSVGTPINATVQIVFSFYNVATGGTALWTETQNVVVAGGVYSVNLGSVNPITLPFDAQYYVGVKVGTDPEMTPRSPLTAVPYAFTANYALSVSIGTGTITSSNIQDGTITNVDISPTAAIDFSKLSGVAASSHNHDATYVNEGQANSITSGMIVDGTVTNVDISPAAGIDFSKLSGVAASSHNHDSTYVNEGQANSITTGMITDGQVTKPKLSASGGASGQVLGTDGTNLVWQNHSGLILPYVGLVVTNQAAFWVSNWGAQGTGIWGLATDGIGVYGEGNGNPGWGVWGKHTGTGNYGHMGTYGAGVEAFGYGNARGVQGQSQNATGVHGDSGNGYGVYGASGSGTGVMGINTGSGNYGELGHSLAGIHAVGTGTTFGVYSESSGGTSVYGVSTTGDGVKGESYGSGKSGVYGLSHQADGYGVYGGNWGGGYGVYGGSGSGTGVYGTSSDGTGVYGSATATGSIVNYGGYFRADGGMGRAVRGEANGTGPGGNLGGSFYAAGDYGVGVEGRTSGWAATGAAGYAPGSNGRGVYGYGGQYDFYAAGPGINFGPFTGGHEVKLSEDFPSNIKPGMIVSVTGKIQARKRTDGTITLSSTLPTVKISGAANDKNVFGVFVQGAPLPHDHWYQKKDGERFGTVNALGEGRVWVSNINGDIEVGDYITTSSVAGYGQRQDDDLLHSYTLGKAIETVDWDSVTETVTFNGTTYKIYLIAVVYTSG